MIRRAGIKLTPLKKIVTGFFFGSAAMIWAAVVQHYIYKASPCDSLVTECASEASTLNIWIQTGPYILIALSEILVVATGLEYAYTEAPRNMKVLVLGFHSSVNGFSAVLQAAFTCEFFVFVHLFVPS